ncbi:MAG TPA: sulfatase-like hydrolase/transferase [Planctomycetaceae bacterium]|nr:sulfatase-like hydrolase/transferase [Planctomycetaceae bacterium]
MSDQSTPTLQNMPRCAVVLTFDRLPLRLLGTYGSSLCQTPHLDRLAARGCVFDSHFAENLNESRIEHVWWSENFPHENSPEARASGLAGRLRETGVKSALVTDRPPASWSLAPSGFETIRAIESSDDAKNSSFAELLAAAEEQLELLIKSDSPWLLWIHSSEMPEIPVPELEFLELYLDELTQLPPETDEDDPQDRPLPAELRAEALEFISQTLELLEQENAELELRHLKVLNVLGSARMSELDHYLGKFFEKLGTSSQGRQALLMLSSDVGLSLGEAALTRQLEPSMTNCPLSEERVHVPLIVKTDELPFLQRCSALTQHSDLPATLCDWFGLDALEKSNAGVSLLPMIRGERESIRKQSVSLADDWRSIRDSNWLLIENRDEGIERLYRQPEDRHQILDVLPHYVEVADRLAGR